MAYEFVENDTGSTLKVTCKDRQAGTVVNLTGATVKLKYTIDGGALATKTMTIQVPGTDGIATYQFLAVELVKGLMVAEVEVTDSGGKILTNLEPQTFLIRPRLV